MEPSFEIRDFTTSGGKKTLYLKPRLNFSMPNRNIHKKISKAIVDDSCEKVHYLIDFPYKFLGNKHRMLFHDPISAVIIGYIIGREKGVISALTHMITDYSLSELNKYIKNLFKV